MEYEVSYDTQIVVPLENNYSKIINSDNEFIVKGNTLNVMEHSCEYFGSSYEGRKNGTKSMVGITHKSPIVVEETNKIIFFPTTSPDLDKCIWINLSQIKNYMKINNKRSKIIFQNNSFLELDISYGSLCNQIMRASRLKCVLEERQVKK